MNRFEIISFEIVILCSNYADITGWGGEVRWRGDSFVESQSPLVCQINQFLLSTQLGEGGRNGGGLAG